MGGLGCQVKELGTCQVGNGEIFMSFKWGGAWSDFFLFQINHWVGGVVQIEKKMGNVEYEQTKLEAGDWSVGCCHSLD